MLVSNCTPKYIFYVQSHFKTYRPSIDPQCYSVRPIFTYIHKYKTVTINNNLKSVLITVSGDRAPVREDYYAGYDGGT